MKTKHGRRKKASQEHANPPRDAAAAPVASPEATEDQATDIRIKRLNLRFVAILLAAGVLVSAGLFLVHAYQTDRNADVLKERAEAALKKGDVSAGMKFLRQYVGLRPRDLDARVQLGDLLYEHAASGQQLLAAFRAYEGVLAEDASRAEVRRRHVDVAMQLQRHSDALAHLQLLVEAARQESGADAEPNGADANGRRNGELGELFILAGECYRAQAKPSQAVGLCLQGLALAPESIRGYRGLASALNAGSRQAPQRDALLRSVPPEFQFEMKTASEPVRQNWAELESLFPAEESGATTSTPAVVEGVLSRMVERGRPTTNALLARAQFRLDFSDLEGSPSLETLQEKQRVRMEQARKDLDAALEISPHDRDVLLLAAEVAFAQAEAAISQGEPAEQFLVGARKYAAQGLEESPPDLRFYLTLGRLELITDGEPEEQYRRAQEHYEAALNALPEVAGEGTPRERLATARIAGDIRWRLADVLITRAQLAGPPGDQKLLSQAREELKSFQQTGTRSPLIEFLSARLMLAEETDQHDRWYRVSQTLHNIRHDMRSRRDLVRRIDLMLGECYEQLANPDARVNVFKRALADDPLWPQGRLALASALVAQERIDDALQEYRFVSGAPGVLLQMARLMILQNASRPESAERPRQWGPVLRLLDDAEKREPDNPLGPVLRAQVLSLQKEYDGARQVLEAAREQHPDEAGLWVALSALELRRDDRAPQERLRDAEQILEQAGQQIGDSVDLRLAAANLAIARGSEVPLELVELETNPEQFSPGERIRLLEGLARAHLRIESLEDARRLWRRLAEERPQNLTYHLATAELARRAKEIDDLPAVLDRIRAIEGPGGPSAAVIEASMLIHEAEQSRSRHETVRDREHVLRLAKARELLRKAAQNRPSWSSVPELLGRVESLLGNEELAVEHYQSAISLGTRTPSVVRDAILFLYDNQRLDQADRLLRQIEQSDPQLFSGALGRLASGVAWEQQQYQKALEIASRLASTSDDYRDKTWKAQLLYREYQKLAPEDRRGEAGNQLLNDAERLYREAIESSGDQPDVWIAYVTHLARVGKSDRAHAVIREAEAALPGQPEYLMPLTLGRCYDVIDAPERAEEHYLDALAAGGEKTEVRMPIADFYFRRKEEAKARPQLEWILGPDSDATDQDRAWANRRRAILIASRGTYQDVMQALSLLPDDASSASLADLRARAAILSNGTSRQHRGMLIAVLEEVDERAGLSERELFQLARLYEQQGEWRSAEPILQRLLAANPDSPYLLAHYARGLIRAARIEPHRTREAERLVERLEALEPRSFRTVTARAELLAAQGRGSQAADAVVEFIRGRDGASPDEIVRDSIENESAAEVLVLVARSLQAEQEAAGMDRLIEAARLVDEDRLDEAIALVQQMEQARAVIGALRLESIKSAAALLERLQQFQASEELYRLYVSRSDRVEADLELARFLGRRERFDEAFQICADVWDLAPAEAVAQSAVAILRSGGKDEHAHWVEERLTSAVRQHPGSVGLALALADLFDFQAKYGQAESIYRGLLRADPRNLWALNNLAWLLAHRKPDSPEALKLINAAIEIAGPIPQFLDTRATVYLARHDSERALADLERVIAQDESARIRYRLGYAQLQAGQRAKARESLRQARAAGFQRAELHPLEEATYATLLEIE